MTAPIPRGSGNAQAVGNTAHTEGSFT
jgi:hypothetical protein